MNKLLLLVSLLTIYTLPACAQKAGKYITNFEQSGGLASVTYDSMVAYYMTLDKDFPQIKMETCGTADGGYDLHVVYCSADGNFDIDNWQSANKTIILINNGIHAGEPDGIDASMMLLRDIATQKIRLPENVVLAVIPAFNIGGMLNRNSYSRANQNGPVSYGFRGNAQNLDLNRDFMKCDAKETRSLERLMTTLDPDIFIDNHVSDGADYQHVMTLLPTQHDKLGGACGDYLYNTLTPLIYQKMKAKGYDLVPYVNNFDNTPDKGWTAFNEPPRFASGYAALFQCFGFVIETHMLKPYPQRVTATYQIMQQIIDIASKQHDDIKKARATDKSTLISQTAFGLEWRVDSTYFDYVTFNGYAARYKASAVSGLPRLYYDHQQPFSKKVPFYDHFKPVKIVNAPVGYVIPRAWEKVIHQLEQHDVITMRFERDTELKVSAYRIENYETPSRPYEKHYWHHNITVSASATSINFKKGDVYIPVQQKAKRYLIEALEPTAPDGFLAWNFFDGILSQKEGFGDYVFEDLAADIVKGDLMLQKQLQEKRQTDTTFAKNAQAQLDYVYRHSRYMEPSYMRYPVFRVE